MRTIGFMTALAIALSASAQATSQAPAGSTATPALTMPMPFTQPAGNDPAFGEPMQDRAAPTPTLSNNMIIATLIDGTKVQFEAAGVVMILHKDGTKTPAPDGMLTLRDGTPFVVKDGKRVSEY